MYNSVNVSGDERDTNIGLFILSSSLLPHLVPRATNVMAVTDGLRPMMHPKASAKSPMRPVVTPT